MSLRLLSFCRLLPLLSLLLLGSCRTRTHSVASCRKASCNQIGVHTHNGVRYHGKPAVL